MESVFYNRFERHDHAEGLKAHATHYCAGCGHGLIHKYVAEAVDALGIQDRTVAISPVGCAVFLYYYLDVGNSQAAHGRAPAVAVGHKVANPDAVVISYQGDGDLASIGLAEIMQVAQMGLPISVVFVNNAIYGMTGGQMAPTTPMDQPTTTSPAGRDRLMGEPLKVAETIAQLDGPIYVERVALYDNKQRTRARKAIMKAIRLQVENRGFGFVEVLSECPTHLHMEPKEAENWVEETLSAIFPLGVKKDIPMDPWFSIGPPCFDPEKVLQEIDASSEPVARFTENFPAHIDPSDVSVKFAGAGGDGAQMIAKLTCAAAINEGYDATYIPSYGPESRGGTSYADVHVARDEVLSPAVPDPHALVVFNPPSMEKFGPTVRPGGVIIYDTSVISELPELDERVRVIGIPASEIAFEMGQRRVKNVVALGALQAATGFMERESLFAALEQAVHGDCALLELNKAAFDKGAEAAVHLV